MDELVLDLLPAEQEKVVSEALRLCREGDLLGLAESPLAQCSLLDQWCVGPHLGGSDARGRATQALLRWLVERLRPDGAQSWLAQSWRAYNVLVAFYFDGLRVAEIAERMAISEQTFYPARTLAVAALTRVLGEELRLPPEQRPNHAIALVYPQLPGAQQTLLRITSVFRQSVTGVLVYRLARLAQVGEIEQHVQQLLQSGMIRSDDGLTSFRLLPKLRPFLRTLLTPEETTSWHYAAGVECIQRTEYLEAAYHWRLAGAVSQVAQLLLAKYQEIIDHAHLSELRTLLAEFRPSDGLDQITWMRLKLLMGDVALQMADVDTAVREYQQALRAPDLRIKAEAYYKRGRAFRATNTDEAEAHLSYGISLLREAAPRDPLLFQLYVEQAWMFFQDRQDAAQGEASLLAAQHLIERDDRARWSDLYNAWGMLYSHQGQHQAAIEQHRQAWLAANEIQDMQRMTHTAHNLGNDYRALERYDQALHYLQQSATLAERAGNRRMQGLCSKSIGACWFGLGEYAQAIGHYEQAHAIFTVMQHHNWQANTCYDLAEAYAELGQQTPMRRYFDEAVRLAKTAGLNRLLRDLHDLARKYVGLYPPEANLNERQRRAFDFVKQHARITNHEYRDLTEVSPKQAARDLDQMVERRTLVRVGDGRATVYVLGSE